MQTNRSFTWVAAALAATAIIAGCESDRYEANRQAVDDATITADVKAALVQDPETRSSNISVNTLHGTVELSGFVDTRGQRDEASRVADNVAGVRSVQNQLQINNQTDVVGTARSDGAITRNVQDALASNPTTQNANIKVSTDHAVVQLAGFVDSRAQRDAAGNIAGSVQGVRSVDNDLRLAP
jgi:hyperosmotically inducible periplasmic protein